MGFLKRWKEYNWKHNKIFGGVFDESGGKSKKHSFKNGKGYGEDRYQYIMFVDKLSASRTQSDDETATEKYRLIRNFYYVLLNFGFGSPRLFRDK